MVLDELRGIETKRTIASYKVELNQENLTNALCKKDTDSGGVLKGKPLLVVVQTPYNPESVLLAEQECMLLDREDSCYNIACQMESKTGRTNGKRS